MARRVTKTGIIYEYAPAIERPATHYWRAFVGPIWRHADNALAYDWSQHDIDDITAAVEEENSLLYTLDPGETTLDLVSAWAWPAAPGGLWIGPGPGTTGQGWEYIDFAAQTDYQATGVVRENATYAQHNRTHDAGAPVRQWYPITTDNGEIHLTHERGDDLLTETWTAKISGARAPAAVLRNDHLLLVESRTSHLDPWQLWLLGWMREPRLSDDHEKNSPWQFQIVSLAGMIDTAEVDGIRVGSFDLAQHGSADSSTVLPTIAAHLDRDNGDFGEAAPDLGADNAITPDASAPWIADRYTGTPDSNPYNYSGMTEIYISLPATVNNGIRYIEFTGVNTSGGVEIIGYDADTPGNMIIEIPAVDLEPAETFILVENEDRFLEHFPSANPARIYSTEHTNFPGFLQRLRAHGGAVAMSFNDVEYNLVVWGDVSTGDLDGQWTTGSWSGASIPAPGPDEVIRYLFNDSDLNQSEASNWTTDKRHTPGYPITDDGDDVWIAVELPALGLTIRDDITDVSPAIGEYLYLESNDAPSVDGLASSGTIVIGDEQLDYMSKNEADGYVVVGSRGANGTTAAAHTAGDAVFYLEPHGYITDAPPISEIQITRQGGTIYPANIVIRTSPLTARRPDESLHENDYNQSYTITGNASATITQAITAGYEAIKTILIEFQYMTTDPARPRVNRIIAQADSTRYTADRWLSGSRSAADVAAAILTAAGVPTGARLAVGGTATIAEQETERAPAWSVLTDLAEQSNTRIRVRLDSKAEAAPDDFWSVAGYTAAQTWTETNTATAEEIRQSGARVRQIRLAWRLYDDSLSGTVVSPADPDLRGQIVELDEQIHPDEATAQTVAQRRFFMARYPHTILLMPAEGDRTLGPGAIHGHSWIFDPEGAPGAYRLCVVQAVDQRIAAFALETALTLREIEQES